MLTLTHTWKQKPRVISDPYFGFPYLTFLFIPMQNQIIFWWSYVQWHTNKLSLSKFKEKLSFENLVWLWKIKAYFQKYMPQFQLKCTVTFRSLQTKKYMALQYTSVLKLQKLQNTQKINIHKYFRINNLFLLFPLTDTL